MQEGREKVKASRCEPGKCWVSQKLKETQMGGVDPRKGFVITETAQERAKTAETKAGVKKWPGRVKEGKGSPRHSPKNKKGGDKGLATD